MPDSKEPALAFSTDLAPARPSQAARQPSSPPPPVTQRHGRPPMPSSPPEAMDDARAAEAHLDYAHASFLSQRKPIG